MRTTATRAVVVGLTSAVVFGLATSTAYAQKGVGDSTGIARQAVKPEVVSLSGKLIEIRTASCEATTGRSPSGTHIILEAPDGKKLNIHLGPADAVAAMAAKLSVGQEVAVRAFRTDKLKAEDFIAQSLTTGKTRIELRDEELRPVWAQNNFSAPGSGPGRGAPGGGRGCGLGWGPGAARAEGCRGMCPGGRGRGAGAQTDVVPGAMGMSAAEHSNVLRLLSSHQEITRKVEEIPGGVRTTTTTTKPELVETLRAHVRQMSRHVKQGQPVRMWDPVFRDIFAHYDEITLVAKDIEGGIEVTETSENPEVVPLIRAHAKKVDGFVAEGHAVLGGGGHGPVEIRQTNPGGKAGGSQGGYPNGESLHRRQNFHVGVAAPSLRKLR